MACLLATELAHAATIVACVGDSITAGAWPGDLGPLLGSSYTVKNYGVSGTTLLKKGDSPYWVTQQFTDSHTVNPNIVIIMLGTNDSKPQNWGTHSGEYAVDYEALIDSYTTLASKPRIFLNLPPPAGTNSYGISGTIIENEILPLVRQTAVKKGTGLIDVFSAFGGHNFDPTLFGSASDQVHPGDKGAQKIADTVAAALKAPADAGLSDAASVDARTSDAASRDAATSDAALSDAALGDAALMPDAAAPPKDAAAPPKDADEPRDVAAPIEAGTGGTGGNTGTAGTGGGSGASGAAGAAAATGGGSSGAAGSTGGGGASDPSHNPAAGDSGCSCRVATVQSDRRGLWAFALVGGIAARRRRKSGRSRPTP